MFTALFVFALFLFFFALPAGMLWACYVQLRYGSICWGIFMLCGAGFFIYGILQRIL